MPVNRCKMNNYITLLNKQFQILLIRKTVVLKWHSEDLLFLKPQKVVKMSSDKSGLTGYADSYHAITN